MSLRSVSKVNGRVFGYTGISEGGNPVTVFLFPKSQRSAPTIDIRSSLARSCDWESVIVYRRRDGNCEGSDGDTLTAETPGWTEFHNEDELTFYFYMPSGEEVSFCAHAAMGACAVIAKENKCPNGNNSIGDVDVHFVSGSTGERSHAVINGEEVKLRMKNRLEENVVDGSKTEEILSEMGLTLEDTGIGVGIEEDENDDLRVLPSFVNSSIARYKTLIPIVSLDKLHSASDPKDATKFAGLCDSIGSTGIYLYTPTRNASNGSLGSVSQYECRQFARASGYPEDPATGIAAATLAASLERERQRAIGASGSGGCVGSGRYEIIQGTAMGKRSRIKVEMEGRREGRGPVSDWVICSGVVEIDSRAEVLI